MIYKLIVCYYILFQSFFDFGKVENYKKLRITKRITKRNNKFSGDYPFN